MKTKYFGNVELAIDDFYCDAKLRAELDGQEIEIGTWSCKNMENLERELPFFWEVVDKYMEINERAKKAIVEYYDLEEEGSINEHGNIKSFFEDVFDFMEEEDRIEIFGVNDLQEVDIKTVVANMRYPDITIYHNFDCMPVCLTYSVSDLEHYSDFWLLVQMDRELHITGFVARLD